MYNFEFEMIDLYFKYILYVCYNLTKLFEKY